MKHAQILKFRKITVITYSWTEKLLKKVGNNHKECWLGCEIMRGRSPINLFAYGWGTLLSYQGPFEYLQHLQDIHNYKLKISLLLSY